MPINSITGLWYNYTMPCLNANFTNVTNSSLNGISCVVSTVSINLPIVWISILVLWYISMFFFMAFDPQRSKTVAIALSGVTFASILAGYHQIDPIVWGAAFGVFILTLFVYLLVGEH